MTARPNLDEPAQAASSGTSGCRQMTKAPGRSLRPQKSMLILETRRPGEGRVLPGGASPPNRSIGVLEKNSQKFLENSEFVWHGCGHGAVGGVFCDATNQELSKAAACVTVQSSALPPLWARVLLLSSLCLNTWIDFDYHRTNDGQRDGGEPAPQGSPLCEP
jgi:hypothetical protein